MPADSSVLMVVVMKDGSLVGSEVFPPGTYRLGRADDMDLCLPDAQVSAHHASFLFTNGQIGIRDENSQGGIFINGEKVKSARIQPRDEIEVAGYRLKMRLVSKRREEGLARVVELAPAPPPTPNSDPFAPANLAAVPGRSAAVGAADFAALEALVDEPPAARESPWPAAEPTPEPARAHRVDAAVGPTTARMDPAGRGAARGDRKALQPRPIPRSVAAAPPPKGAVAAALAPRAAIAPAAKQNRKFFETVSMDRPKGKAAASAHSQPGRQGPAKRPIPAPLPPPTDTQIKAGKVSKKPVLRAQFLWGEPLDTATIAGARTFLSHQAVIAGPFDRAPLPVYGFPSSRRFRLATFRSGKWQVRVPEGVDLLLRDGTRYLPEPVPADSLVALGEQDSLILHGEGVAVELISELAGPRIPASFKPQVERSYWVPMVVALAFIGALIVYSATRPPIPDFKPQGLPPIRAILQAPKKKKVEPKVVEKAPERQKVPEKKLPEVVHTQQKPPKQLPVQPPAATAAVQKLLNPKVMTKLFSALNNVGAKGKLGNGMDYKATGLIGKLPLAMGGSGSALGLGKGFGGGGLGGVGFAGLKTAALLGRENVGRRGVVGAPVTIPRGAGKVQGELPMEAVRKVVDAHFAAIQRCYEGALIRNPSIAGKVTFEWTIGTDGNVKVVKTKVSTLPSADVPDCIRSDLVTWHFPAPKGGVVVVSYPFLFNSVGN